MAKILITGSAGFIGYHLTGCLAGNEDIIVGLDNMNPNHDFLLKKARLEQLGFVTGNNAEQNASRLMFVQADLLDKKVLESIFAKHHFDLVIHLAAQTGVRQSVLLPQLYIDNNITAFNNLLDCCNRYKVGRIIYASSSSVYGTNNRMPYRESDNTDQPVSIYAVTKKTNELLAGNYAAGGSMSLIGLRFFTVYGPWCRSDMAAYIFMKAITEGSEISLFNDGDMLRDFTYVEDVVKSICLFSRMMLEGKIPATGHEVYNVGNRNPSTLSEYLSAIEKEMGSKARITYKPIQPGEVQATYADVQKLMNATGFKPETRLTDGVRKMVEWFRDFYPLSAAATGRS